MCFNAILGCMTILLIVVTTLPCIVIPIVMICMVVPSCMLIWCPHRLCSTLKDSMSILLAIVAMSFNFFCSYDISPAILCHMPSHIALVAITFALRYALLIDPFTPVDISSMSLFIAIMTSGFRILTFVTSLFSTLWWFTNFRTSVSKSWCVMCWSWGFQQLFKVLDGFTWLVEILNCLFFSFQFILQLFIMHP